MNLDGANGSLIGQDIAYKELKLFDKFHFYVRFLNAKTLPIRN